MLDCSQPLVNPVPEDLVSFSSLPGQPHMHINKKTNLKKKECQGYEGQIKPEAKQSKYTLCQRHLREQSRTMPKKSKLKLRALRCRGHSPNILLPSLLPSLSFQLQFSFLTCGDLAGHKHGLPSPWAPPAIPFLFNHWQAWHFKESLVGSRGQEAQGEDSSQGWGPLVSSLGGFYKCISNPHVIYI